MSANAGWAAGLVAAVLTWGASEVLRVLVPIRAADGFTAVMTRGVAEMLGRAAIVCTVVAVGLGLLGAAPVPLTFGTLAGWLAASAHAAARRSRLARA